MPEDARRHILIAMVWGLDAYDPGSALAMIRRGGDEQVSDAAQWLAFSASRSAEMPLDAAVEFCYKLVRGVRAAHRPGTNATTGKPSRRVIEVSCIASPFYTGGPCRYADW